MEDTFSQSSLDRNECFAAIFAKFVRYAQHHHSWYAVVVFDGFPEHNKKSMSSAERVRRLKFHTSAKVQFNETMFPFPQDKLLGNDKNQSTFYFYAAKGIGKSTNGH